MGKWVGFVSVVAYGIAQEGHQTHAFSMATGSSAPSAVSEQYSDSVYWNQLSAAHQLDQAAFGSIKFWADVDEHIPQWRSSMFYERFRGFCDNLQTQPPGKETVMPNGQELLSQYIFPGLDAEDDVKRCAYPTQHFKALRRLQDSLARDVQPVARRELSALLDAVPLVSDDERLDNTAENDGDTWQRAAWYGWQYLSLRGARRHMPDTAAALKEAMGSMGPAHRFVGLTRQKHNCTGVVHSDGRNYMLSTLTPVVCPEGCGIVVNGEDATLHEEPLILDNTFLHQVYNHHPTDDRFCLMSECYHPALTRREVDAIATVFALKDRFTVQELQMAPWGYDDDDLEMALKTGAVNDVQFWKEIGYNPTSETAARGKDSGGSSPKSKKKKSKGKAGRGFG